MSADESQDVCYWIFVFRPTATYYAYMTKKSGQGYCPECRYDPENNPKCPGYRPILMPSNMIQRNLQLNGIDGSGRK